VITLLPLTSDPKFTHVGAEVPADCSICPEVPAALDERFVDVLKYATPPWVPPEILLEGVPDIGIVLL
jgi:hypothetical protein